MTTTNENKSRPLLLTVIVAQAISSVGYGVSLFAIGVIWLLPAVKPVVPAQVKTKRKPHNYRRRSAPPVMTVPKSPLPSLLSNRSKSSPDSPRNRHVYFADSPTQISSFPRQTDLFQDSLDVLPLDASPRSSSSTLVTSQCNDSSLKSDPTESDRSSCSSRPTPRFSTKITSWSRKPSGKKSSCNADPGVEANYSDETSAEFRNKDRGRISSLTFPWTASKTKSSPETTIESISGSPFSPQTALPSRASTAPDIVTFTHTTKPQRRVSAPAPVRGRTQPYAYPYFATPPAPQPATPAATTKVVDSSDESLERLVPDGQLPEASSRRQQNAAAQASLGLGHRRPPPRRAMSECVV